MCLLDTSRAQLGPPATVPYARLRDQRPDLHALVMADAMSGREGITGAEWPEWCSGTRPVYGLHPVLNSGMEQTFCYAAQPLRKV
jgi:hypothetical protein